MGSTESKEKLMTTAIEDHDVDEMRIVMRDLTPEQINVLCKSLVPGNENQCTIFHYATWQNNSELLILLIDYVDDLEMRDGLGWTPLMTAVNRDSKENVEMLLERGAKIDCDSVGGMDLIAAAMSYNDIELIQILMDHGAQVTTSSNIHVNGDDKTGCFLLHFAVDDGLIDIARLLIEKGKIPVNTLDQAGCSSLHLASGHNYSNTVELLLSKGADVNIKDQHGNTPLAWAKQTSAMEVINELESHGGIADNIWHGEKLKLKTTKKHKSHWIVNNHFDIEDSNGEHYSNGKGLDIPDALQSRRSIEQSKF